MSTVFFKISTQQDKELKNLMEGEGYTSKAEFFRFLIKFYKYKKSPEEIRFEKAADELASTLIKLDKQGKLGKKSLKEQLADI